MSKVDAQRAMREARYAAQRVAEPRPVVPGRPAVAAPALVTADAGLCGHRNIGNKSCRRPVGHAEKSHRYA